MPQEGEQCIHAVYKAVSRSKSYVRHCDPYINYQHPLLIHTGFTYERFRCYCTLQPMRSPSGHDKLGEYYYYY